MNTYFKSLLVASLFISGVATRYGKQSKLQTMSNYFCVEVEDVEKEDVKKIEAYAQGIIFAVETLQEVK